MSRAPDAYFHEFQPYGGDSVLSWSRDARNEPVRSWLRGTFVVFLGGVRSEVFRWLPSKELEVRAERRGGAVASETCSKRLEFVDTQRDGGATMVETKAESKSVYPVGAPEIAQRRNKYSP